MSRDPLQFQMEGNSLRVPGWHSTRVVVGFSLTRDYKMAHQLFNGSMQFTAQYLSNLPACTSAKDKRHLSWLSSSPSTETLRVRAPHGRTRTAFTVFLWGLQTPIDRREVHRASASRTFTIQYNVDDRSSTQNKTGLSDRPISSSIIMDPADLFTDDDNPDWLNADDGSNE